MFVFSFFVWMEFVLPDIAYVLQVDLLAHSIKSMIGLFLKKKVVGTSCCAYDLTFMVQILFSHCNLNIIFILFL